MKIIYHHRIASKNDQYLHVEGKRPVSTDLLAQVSGFKIDKKYRISKHSIR